MNDEGFEIIKKNEVCSILNKETKWRIGSDAINK